MDRRRMMLKQDTKPAGALYWYGDECTDLTGGWGLSTSTGTLVKHSDHMEFSFNYDTAIMITSNTIDITPYRTLYVEAAITQGATSNMYVSFSPDWNKAYITTLTSEYSIQSTQFVPDITRWQGTQYIRAVGQYSYTSTGTMLIKRIWLE